MNNKIYELCVKAISDVDGIENPNTQTMFIPDCFRDRFAELIIQECVDVCLSQPDPANLNYRPSVRFAGAIKECFGLPQ